MISMAKQAAQEEKNKICKQSLDQLAQANSLFRGSLFNYLYENTDFTEDENLSLSLDINELLEASQASLINYLESIQDEGE